MAHDFQEEMQGRIIALELLMRGLLTDVTCRNSQPLKTAKRLSSEFLASLQNINRDVSEYDDRVWERAADAMRSTFDQVIQRVVHLQKTEQIPKDE